jgi:hypothetical protein
MHTVVQLQRSNAARMRNTALAARVPLLAHRRSSYMNRSPPVVMRFAR